LKGRQQPIHFSIKKKKIYKNENRKRRIKLRIYKKCIEAFFKKKKRAKNKSKTDGRR
jgi:hypothetical protein